MTVRGDSVLLRQCIMNWNTRRLYRSKPVVVTEQHMNKATITL